jgi:hypothetical protein
VAELVLGMAQVEPPQERIAGQLGGAGQVAPAVRLGLGEAQELAGAAVRVEPHPAVQRPEREVQRGRPHARGELRHGAEASTAFAC